MEAHRTYWQAKLWCWMCAVMSVTIAACARSPVGQESDFYTGLPASQQANCFTLAIERVHEWDPDIADRLLDIYNNNNMTWTNDTSVWYGQGWDYAIQFREGWYDDNGECNIEMLAADMVHELYHAENNLYDDGYMEDAFGRGQVGHNPYDDLGCCVQ